MWHVKKKKKKQNTHTHKKHTPKKKRKQKNYLKKRKGISPGTAFLWCIEAGHTRIDTNLWEAQTRCAPCDQRATSTDALCAMRSVSIEHRRVVRHAISEQRAHIVGIHTVTCYYGMLAAANEAGYSAGSCSQARRLCKPCPCPCPCPCTYNLLIRSARSEQCQIAGKFWQPFESVNGFRTQNTEAACVER